MPFHLYVSALFYLAVPCLVFVAYRDWTKRIRESLSNWRSRLGPTSLLLISADWCSVTFLMVAAEASLGWASPIDESWFNYLKPGSNCCGTARTYLTGQSEDLRYRR